MKTQYLSIFLLLLSLNSFAQSNKQLISDLKTLSSSEFEGRLSGTNGNNKAAQYIIGRFNTIGLKSYADSFKHPFIFKNRQNEDRNGVNLLGYIPGKSNKAIVISAHYDHVGVNEGKIYYGADDNASGVSVLLYIAEYFKSRQPEHTLVFAAFDAEESGLRGATAFVKEPPFVKSDIVLNVNMDMVSRSDKGELYASGTYKTPSIKDLLKDAGQDTGVKLLFGHDLPGSGHNDWTFQSDQGAFARENIPFVYFGGEDHADYHKPTDTFENVEQSFFQAAAQLILKCTQMLDAQFAKP